MSQRSDPPAVLLITRNLPPLRGGMERLNLHLVRVLAEWGKLTVIGPAGCGDFLPASVQVIEIPVRPLPLYLLRSLWTAWRQAGARLDIALAGSGLTAPAVKLAAWHSGAKSAAYVHGLDVATPHPLYRAVWIPALRRLDHAFANSANTADIAARQGVARGRLTILHPGVSLPETLANSADEFRQRHGLGNAPLLLSVGRMTERKGLFEFVRNVLPAIHARHRDVVLVIIGDEAPDALSGSGAGARQRLLALAAELGLDKCLHFLGPCDDATLSQAYFAADVHVFPVRAIPGDIEGFGMVAIEAAAHGLPTVAFAVGGVPDAVRPDQSGFLILPGDYARFADRVCELLDAGRATPMRQTAREVAKEFRWEQFGERLLAALNELEQPADSRFERRGHADNGLPTGRIKRCRTRRRKWHSGGD